MDRSRVAIIIPALNEEETIGSVIRAVIPYGVPIVIDDGSNDNTAQISTEMGAITHTNPSNLGYDGALNAGFKIANLINCEYAITFDADNQHNPCNLKVFISLLMSGADLVIGIRPKFQRMGEYVFAMLFKKFLKIEDPLCGLKGYNMIHYKKLGHFDSYQSIGTELMVFIAINGGKIYNHEILVSERIDQPRFGNIFYANIKIFRALIFALSKVLKIKLVNSNDSIPL
jgi:glycosyltransferase involved in cell wall biosynthesis